MNVPALPTVNVVAFALVIAGAPFTVSVKVWSRWRRRRSLAVNVSA